MIYIFGNKTGRISRLTPNRLSQEIKDCVKEIENEKNQNGDWDKEIFIDLSDIKWFNISSLVELILIMEAWLREGISLTISLPNPNELLKEKEEINNTKNNNTISEEEKKKKINSIRKHSKERRKTRAWLHTIKIVQALKFEHLYQLEKKIIILDVFDRDLFERSSLIPNHQAYKIYGPNDAPAINTSIDNFLIPLSWIDNSVNEDSTIYSLLKNHLSEYHSAAISKIIIGELIKNVIEHSGNSHGLLCAKISPYRKFHKEVSGKIISQHWKADYFKDELPFFVGCVEGELIVEIAFGDSGAGLCNTLRQNTDYKKNSEKDLIRIAFDKWSTRNPDDPLKRGTRGLFYIENIVKQYDGMVGVRTDKHFLGINEQINTLEIEKLVETSKIKDLGKREIDGKRLSKFNGTLLTIRLIPNRRVSIKERFYSRYEPIEPHKNSFERLPIKYPDINSLEKALNEIITKREADYLIPLNFPSKSTTIDNAKEFIFSLLKKLSLLRSKNFYILYGLPVAWTEPEIQALVSGINEDLIKERKNDGSPYLEFSPVMIICPNGTILWSGVNNLQEIRVLKEISQVPEHNIGVTTVENTCGQGAIDLVKKDSRLFRVHQDRIYLTFDKKAPVRKFKVELKKRIDALVNGNANVIEITPSLRYVKGWFDIKSLFDEFREEYIYSIYTLWMDKLTNVLEEQIKINYRNNSTIDINELLTLITSNLKVLVFSDNEIELAESFYALVTGETYDSGKANIKVYSDEFDSKLARRNPLFETTDFVIILSTVVFTHETARNLVKSVLRSRATSLCFLSLIDFSEEYNSSEQVSNRIKETWGASVLHYSFHSDKRAIARERISPFIYRNPDWKILSNIPGAENYRVDPELRGMIIRSRSLHFSHIGKFNSRHFTFYLSAKRLLSNEKNRELLSGQIIKKIFDWEESLVEPMVSKELIKLTDSHASSGNSFLNIDEQAKESSRLKRLFIKNSRQNTTIWSPASEFSIGTQGRGLSEIISGKIVKIPGYENVSVDTVFRNENIEPLARYPLDTKSVIVFDWGALSGESIENYISIANSHGYKNILVCILFNQLPERKRNYFTSISELRNNLMGNSPIFSSNVEIKFVFEDFPLNCSETQYECNICTLREDLFKYQLKGEVFEKFAKDRRKYLDLKPRPFTDNEPTGFYPKEIFNSEFIWEMFEFKALLIKAHDNTYWRLMVKKLFFTIINSSSPEKISLDIEIYSEYEKIFGESKIMHPEWFTPLNSDYYNSSNKFGIAHAIVFFLSIETAWLQRPPLSNPQIRILLCLITKRIIMSTDLSIADTTTGLKDTEVIRLKYAAVTILRIVSKKEFINSITDIIRSTQIEDIGSESIIENIIFHINTFISKDYHESHENIDQLLENLKLVEESFDLSHPKYWRIKREIKNARWLFNLKANNLVIRGRVRKLKKSQIVRNILKILNEELLDEEIKEYRYDHSLVLKLYSELMMISSGDIPKLKEYFFNTYYNNWLYVSGFIKNVIGTHIKEIESVFRSNWSLIKGYNLIYSNLFPYDFGIDDPFSQLIHQFRNKEKDYSSNEDFILSYNKAYKNIGRLFLENENDKSGNSKVKDLLENLSSNLVEAVLQTRSDFESEVLFTPTDNLNYQIFCPKELLRDLFNHIFRNAVQKKLKDKVPGIIIHSKTIYPDTVELVVINKNTSTKITGKRKGLKGFQDQLGHFYGSIEYDPDALGDFTVYLKFLKYE